VDEKRFWDIMSVCSPHDDEPEDWGERLEAELRKLEPAEIVAFDHLFDDKTEAAYRRDLWSAANVINGGASDDGFYYFCCWLVAMGKQVYEAALANPDSLADVVDPGEEYEAEIYGAARGAWYALGLDESEYDRAYEALGRRVHSEPAGEWVETDQEFRRRFPRLAELYFDRDDEDDDEDDE
jgi:hypothetical protein